MDIVERLNGYIAYNTKQSREEDDVMREAAAEIVRLRDALEPFASLGAKMHAASPDSAPLVLTSLNGGIIDTDNRVTVGDLRAALSLQPQT